MPVSTLRWTASGPPARRAAASAALEGARATRPTGVEVVLDEQRAPRSGRTPAITHDRARARPARRSEHALLGKATASSGAPRDSKSAPTRAAPWP